MTRASARGRGGAIAAGHLIPAEVGLAVLADGGNAVDAIVAAAFAAFVVEPAMCGVGGHGRLSVYLADRDEAWGIDHFIVAPDQATPAVYDAALADARAQAPDIPPSELAEHGPLSVAVPGAVAGLCAAIRRFGTWDRARLLAPAIALAEAGIAIDGRTGQLAESRARTIARFDGLARWLAGGPRLDGRDLAVTLRQIADGGEDAFYRGPIAEAIARACAGGLLSLADLAAYAPRIARQDWAGYRGLRHVTCGDLIAVEALNLLESFDLASHGADSPLARHLLAEALAQAFVDNAAYGGDETNPDLPLAGLASKEYARHMAQAIPADRARAGVAPGEPWRFGTAGGPARAFAGTTQICAVDRAGNVASLITSIDSAFGSMILVPGTGILLGNGLQLFGLFRDGRNPIAPRRMPLYGAPVMVARDDRGALGAFAGAGGYRIASGILNTLVNVVDHGMPLERAIEHPRLHADGAGIEVDVGVPEAVRRELARMGHRVGVGEATPLSWPFARTSALWRDEDGLWTAASGPGCGAAAALP
jgi:gamma-glutamyltranspeptidase/glutathione hydrolase